MWTKTYSMVTKEVTKEQMWELFADVNKWNSWDEEIEFTKMEGKFEQGNRFILRPKGGPNVTVELIETIENQKFVDVTKFPMAKMYDEHLFEETQQGLKITNKISVKGFLSFLWVRLIARKIAEAMPKDMQQQIKAASML